MVKETIINTAIIFNPDVVVDDDVDVVVDDVDVVVIVVVVDGSDQAARRIYFIFIF